MPKINRHKLKRLRISKGMSREQLALKTIDVAEIGEHSINTSTVWRIEKGKTKREDWNTIRVIAKALDVEIKELLIQDTQDQIETLSADVVDEIPIEYLFDISQKQRSSALNIVSGDISQSKKYCESLYVTREEESAFWDYLETGSNLIGFVGEAGTGKTNLICELVQKTSNKHICFFYLSNQINRSFEEIFLYDWMKYVGKQDNIVSISESINNLLIAKNHYLLIFIDAINECSKPSILKSELGQLAYKLRDSRIKFCISCRDYDWDRFLLEEKAKPSFFSEQLYSPEKYRKEKKIGVWLSNFEKDTFNNAWNKYKRDFKISESPDSELEYLLYHPLMLRIYCEIYHKRESLFNESPGRFLLLSEYLEYKLTESYDILSAKQVINAIAEEISINKSQTVSINNVLIKCSDVNKPLDVINKLLMNNVLVPIKTDDDLDQAIQFYYENLMEYVVGFHLYNKWKQYSDIKALRLELINLIESQIEFTNSASIIQFAFLASNRKNDIVRHEILEILLDSGVWWVKQATKYMEYCDTLSENTIKNYLPKIIENTSTEYKSSTLRCWKLIKKIGFKYQKTAINLVMSWLNKADWRFRSAIVNILCVIPKAKENEFTEEIDLIVNTFIKIQDNSSKELLKSLSNIAIFNDAHVQKILLSFSRASDVEIRKYVPLYLNDSINVHFFAYGYEEEFKRSLPKKFVYNLLRNLLNDENNDVLECTLGSISNSHFPKKIKFKMIEPFLFKYDDFITSRGIEYISKKDYVTLFKKKHVSRIISILKENDEFLLSKGRARTFLIKYLELDISKKIKLIIDSISADTMDIYIDSCISELIDKYGWNPLNYLIDINNKTAEIFFLKYLERMYEKEPENAYRLLYDILKEKDWRKRSTVAKTLMNEKIYKHCGIEDFYEKLICDSSIKVKMTALEYGHNIEFKDFGKIKSILSKLSTHRNRNLRYFFAENFAKYNVFSLDEKIKITQKLLRSSDTKLRQKGVSAISNILDSKSTENRNILLNLISKYYKLMNRWEINNISYYFVDIAYPNKESNDFLLKLVYEFERKCMIEEDGWKVTDLIEYPLKEWIIKHPETGEYILDRLLYSEIHELIDRGWGLFISFLNLNFDKSMEYLEKFFLNLDWDKGIPKNLPSYRLTERILSIKKGHIIKLYNYLERWAKGQERDLQLATINLLSQQRIEKDEWGSIAGLNFGKAQKIINLLISSNYKDVASEAKYLYGRMRAFVVKKYSSLSTESGIIDYLNLDTDSVILEIYEALRTIKNNSNLRTPKVLLNIAPLLKTDNYDDEIFEIIELYGKNAKPILESSCKHEEWKIRAKIASYLGLLGKAWCLNLLGDLCYDSNIKVRMNSVRALRFFSNPKSEKLLKDIILDQNSEIKKAAEITLIVWNHKFRVENECKSLIKNGKIKFAESLFKNSTKKLIGLEAFLDFIKMLSRMIEIYRKEIYGKNYTEKNEDVPICNECGKTYYIDMQFEFIKEILDDNICNGCYKEITNHYYFSDCRIRLCKYCISLCLDIARLFCEGTITKLKFKDVAKIYGRNYTLSFEKSKSSNHPIRSRRSKNKIYVCYECILEKIKLK